MKNNSTPIGMFAGRPSANVHGQTVRNGRLINTNGCGCTTGLQKIVDMKRSMKRAEKVSVMSEAMSIAKMMNNY